MTFNVEKIAGEPEPILFVLTLPADTDDETEQDIRRSWDLLWDGNPPRTAFLRDGIKLSAIQPISIVVNAPEATVNLTIPESVESVSISETTVHVNVPRIEAPAVHVNQVPMVTEVIRNEKGEIVGTVQKVAV